MTTNRHRLVAQVLSGQVAPAVASSGLYDVGADGVPRILPGVGGITLNVRVGDSAFGFEADHVEPAVSARHPDEAINRGFCTFACIGNVATVASGEAKGERGVVTGKHGGVDHVMVDFTEAVMERMQIGDLINVRAVGVGLRLEREDDIGLFNGDPELFEKMNLTGSGSRVQVPVARVVPAAVMGSGLGRSASGAIEPVVDDRANLATILGLR